MSAKTKFTKRPNSEVFTKPRLALNRVASLQLKKEPKKVVRDDSLDALDELVQCGICLERLSDPRMLHCQHTFCLTCLQTHIIAKNLKIRSDNTSVEQMKVNLSENVKSFQCPMCQKEVALEKGFDSLEELPKNLYIDSLLKLMDGGNSPISPKVVDYRCVNCKTVSEQQEHVCQHCMQIFCEVCWNDHISELDTNLVMLVRQIDESESRLKHKAENFATRCDQLNDTVKESVEQKIAYIQKMEKVVLKEVASIKEDGSTRYMNIDSRILDLKDKIQYNIKQGRNSNKITTYMNLHRETAKILNEVYHYGEARLIFDPETFRLEQDTEGIYNDTEESTSVLPAKSENPFESVDAMVKHYRSRSFVPKLLWTKCPRPGGVGIPPWDTSRLLIAAMDSHNVLVLDRSRFKLVERISHPEMICPSALAFSKSRKEIYVSDKWKHCVHVFSSDGQYLRSACNEQLSCPEGIAMGPNEELIICDTGNDRVLVVNSETGALISIIGRRGTKLHVPTGVAVYGANVIVADTGNHKIKIFNMEGTILHQFGSLGRNRGQFRSAEVVAVDCLGFIFVGDGGNARIQVFQPDGTLVKIFGSGKGFKWISGIYVTPELDIIATDCKACSLRIF
ncbi:tripartite motif-containing protein 2 [Anoplophora glabripennis]|uniref:tripartite motif-containing protein 2 n=1 Tax=Anoplophora glabripennis TaxID=217634 RepID=UPI000874C2CB|nr:tripartite motif-containing protein 2 [Anoplophora glabripennis]